MLHIIIIVLIQIDDSNTTLLLMFLSLHILLEHLFDVKILF